MTETLFTCIGRVDKVTDTCVKATLFRNKKCDDPKGIKLQREDFPVRADKKLPEGYWFTLEKKREKTDNQVTHITTIKPFEEDEQQG